MCRNRVFGEAIFRTSGLRLHPRVREDAERLEHLNRRWMGVQNNYEGNNCEGNNCEGNTVPSSKYSSSGLVAGILSLDSDAYRSRDWTGLSNGRHLTVT